MTMADRLAFRAKHKQALCMCLALGSSAIVIFIVPTAQGETRVLFQNSILVGTSAVAFALSIIISFRFSVPAYRRTFAMLMVGLGLWCAAEITWTYYVQALNVEVPFPSAADWFYLGGYTFVGYFLLRIVRRLMNVNKRNVLVVTTISVSIVASIINIFILDLVRESFTVTSLPAVEVLALALSVAYPIFDGLLLIPSMVILYESRGSRNEYFSWVLMSIAMLLLGIGDTGFGYTALKDVESLADEAIWDIIYSLSYIFIIVSLAHEFLTIRSKGNYPLLNPS